MTKVQLEIAIVYEERRIVLKFSKPPRAPLRCILEDALFQSGLADVQEHWVLRYRGRALDLDQTLAHLLDGIEDRKVVRFDLSVAPEDEVEDSVPDACLPPPPDIDE